MPQLKERLAGALAEKAAQKAAPAATV